MKTLCKAVFLLALFFFSVSSKATIYNAEYRCKFLQSQGEPPKPDVIKLFFHTLNDSKVEWKRQYYFEEFKAKNIYMHDDSFIKLALLNFRAQPVRAFKVSARDPLSMHFMRFVVLLDSVEKSEFVSGVWLLTTKKSFLSDEVLIAKEHLNCREKF